MDETTHKSSCTACAGHIAFPAGYLGMTIDCPHCGQKTVLLAPASAAPVASEPVPAVALPAPGKRSRGRRWVWSVFLLLGLVGLVAGGWLVTRSPVGKPVRDRWQARSLKAGPVALEKVEETSLVYASGLVRNASDRRRFGLHVEIELLDGAGKKIGVADDYLGLLEPNTEWRFRALLSEPGAASARVSRVWEETE